MTGKWRRFNMGKILKTYTHIITSPYGKRGDSWHGGVDITGYKNCTHLLDYICAKAAGTVVAVRNNCPGFESGGSYGNYVIIDHGSGYRTVYAHMACGSVKSKVGDKVTEGQVIGYMGNTGTSYGGHLHFEVRLNNERIDPTKYLTEELPLNKPEPKPEPKPVEVDINPGDTVIVNGIGYENSFGGGRKTRQFVNHKMKVIAEVKNDRKCPFALNQYNSGRVGDYSQVTAWFSKADIKKV